VQTSLGQKLNDTGKKYFKKTIDKKNFSCYIKNKIKSWEPSWGIKSYLTNFLGLFLGQTKDKRKWHYLK